MTGLADRDRSGWPDVLPSGHEDLWDYCGAASSLTAPATRWTGPGRWPGRALTEDALARRPPGSWACPAVRSGVSPGLPAPRNSLSTTAPADRPASTLISGSPGAIITGGVFKTPNS